MDYFEWSIHDIQWLSGSMSQRSFAIFMVVVVVRVVQLHFIESLHHVLNQQFLAHNISSKG